MKDFVFLGFALVVHALMGGAVLCATSGCTPAERQGFDQGVDLATSICVFAAQCAGRTDIAAYCRITDDVLDQAQKLIGDPVCPLDGGADGH
jgi:hypothetical protein